MGSIISAPTNGVFGTYDFSPLSSQQQQQLKKIKIARAFLCIEARGLYSHTR